jgi:hypothetical protein
MLHLASMYLRQYHDTDPELRGCDELGNSDGEQLLLLLLVVVLVVLVNDVYKDIDGMSDNLERGHLISV